jgi:hypothetical protein
MRARLASGLETGILLALGVEKEHAFRLFLMGAHIRRTSFLWKHIYTTFVSTVT